MTDGGPSGAPGLAVPRGQSWRADVLLAAQALARPVPEAQGGATSDLSVDEVLLLHSIGWEPVDLVFGSSVASTPPAAWGWGQGEIVVASESWDIAFRGALHRLVGECARVDGFGVVGVQIDTEIERLHTDVELVGTAVRPIAKAGQKVAQQLGRPFASDLSARDYALLVQTGWRPVGLAFGASFVNVPRRSVSTTISQKGQNVELTNFTEAMYTAREAAMSRLQDSAVSMDAGGIVDVSISEGPMVFARHAIGFTAWGTAIVPGPEGHRHLEPKMVLPLDDLQVTFQATALRQQGGEVES